MVFGRERLDIKTPAELRIMRRAGLVLARTLAELADTVSAGRTTAELDAQAERLIRSQGGEPSFPLVPEYRHTLCVSVNEQVVHGIPGAFELAEGDLVSIDCGVVVDGWHADAAVSLVVGGDAAASADDLALVAATRASLWAGITAFTVGGHVGDIGAAVEDSLEESGRLAPAGPRSYGIVDGYEGHGIGREMHMSPGVPNVRTRQRGPRVRSGATVAIEPMVSLGTDDTRELEDEWTVVTTDGSRAAHWEHTVAVTDAGLWVLTALDGGEQELASWGARYAPLD